MYSCDKNIAITELVAKQLRVHVLELLAHRHHCFREATLLKGAITDGLHKMISDIDQILAAASVLEHLLCLTGEAAARAHNDYACTL